MRMKMHPRQWRQAMTEADDTNSAYPGPARRTRPVGRWQCRRRHAEHK